MTAARHYNVEDRDEDSAAYKADLYTAKFTDHKAQCHKKDWQDLGGAHTEGFERYVRKLFTPSALSGSRTGWNSMAQYDYMHGGYAGATDMDDVPAGVQLKMARMEEGESLSGKPALYSPLEMMSSYYGDCGITDKPYKQFEVYQPKSTSEYYSIMNAKAKTDDSASSITYKVTRTESSPNVWGTPLHDYSRYRLGGRHVPHINTEYTMTEFRNPSIAALSPYQHDSEYHRLRESRIVGSNFVLTSPKEEDPFIAKCKKLVELGKRREY